MYFLKPIVWNPRGYVAPAGVRFTSGFPAKEGFTHEEWNNSPRLTYEEGGVSYQVFHTEPLGNQPLNELRGDIFFS